MGLPEYYAPMVMGLEASGQVLRADFVKSKILQDVKLKHGLRSAGDEGALYAGEKQRRRQGGGGPKKGACYTCNEPGHYAANCPKKSNSNLHKKDKKRVMCAVFAMGDVDQNEWYFDSGATSHMARSGADFEAKAEVSLHVGTANNSSMLAKAEGTVNLDCIEGSVDVRNVLEVPDIATNLLSIGRICENGFTVVFTKDDCKVLTEDGQTFASGTADGGLYRLNRKSPSAFVCSDVDMWHKRLGYLNIQSLKQLQTVSTGMQLKGTQAGECIKCVEGKQPRASFPISETRATERLQLVHTDLCGPFEVPSLGGSRYFISFIDDATRKLFVYNLETKDQAQKAFQNFRAMVERQTGCRLKVLRSDNGREYINASFKTILERDGIRHQKTCPYTPEQNGVAERMNRTIIEKVRCMLNEAKLPKQFWAEAVNTAAYTINRCPTRSLGGITPEEAWTGLKPDVSHLKVFGSTGMVHIPKQRRKKLDLKSKKCIFLGYAEETKGYRMYNPDNEDVIISRDVVIINEGRCEGLKTKHHETVNFLEIKFEEPVVIHRGNPEPDVREMVQGSSSVVEDGLRDTGADFALPPQSSKPADIEHEFRCSGRERRHPGKYTDFISFSTYTGQNVSPELQQPDLMLEDPTSYEEVLGRPDRDRWMTAMREEIEALESNETWVLENLPKGQKAIRNKWVYKTKRGPNGEVERYKARLAVKGCSQRPGIDYDEVYAPVVRYSTIRFLMAMAVKHDLQIDQMDAVTAFLQGELKDEVIFMDQPEGFGGNRRKVCRLRKAMYGLKQSSRVWNNQLDKALQEFGLCQSKVDTCLYYQAEGDRMIFVTVYVDDFLIFTNDERMKKRLKRFLCDRFRMKDLGVAEYCLGIRINRDSETGEISLDQQNYVEEVLRRFQMENCHPVNSPFEPSEKMDKSMSPSTPEEQAEMKNVPYKEAVGCLLYLSQATRPDIA